MKKAVDMLYFLRDSGFEHDLSKSIVYEKQRLCTLRLKKYKLIKRVKSSYSYLEQ